MNTQTECLQKGIQKAIEEGVDYLFVYGSLNYRIKVNGEYRSVVEVLNSLGYHYKQISRELLAKYDEIANQFEMRHIETLLEGEDNEGPKFSPTCILSSGRSRECQSIANWTANKPANLSGKQYDRYCYVTQSGNVPMGWCDRIFYQTYHNKPSLTCEYYDSTDDPNFLLGNHRAVYGIYEISG
jgi:hypothetical protein